MKSVAAQTAIDMGARSLGDAPDGWSKITQRRYPFLWEACSAISHDSGAGADHAQYNVPPAWIPKLDDIEHAVSLLSKEDRETMAIGECSEQEAIVAEGYGLLIAHEFLNAFFEDFLDHEEPDDLAPAVTAGNREGQT